MNYDLFLAAWLRTLAAAHLQTLSFPTETIVLRTMARAYNDYVSLGMPFRASRFTITAELRWEWDALSSARSETVEEDMLMQLLGDERRDTPTEPPWLRVDVVLHATRPLGEPLPMPSPAAWRRWAAEVRSRPRKAAAVPLRERGWLSPGVVVAGRAGSAAHLPDRRQPGPCRGRTPGLARHHAATAVG